MQIGAHVSSAGGLLPAIERGAALAAGVIQLHPGSPRVWRPAGYPRELLESFAEAISTSSRPEAAFCHASYLINLGATNAALVEASAACLAGNLEVASRMGSSGLVLHLGSHLGAGFESVTGLVAERLEVALDEAERRLGRTPCRVLMENTAGAGGTIGRSFEELAAVMTACGRDERLGLCLDTQHLYASGITYESLDEADAVVEEIDRLFGLDRLGLVHLNDSKVAFGSNRDRHENPGEGMIGARALGSLVGHPRLEKTPAVLEVPGREKKGPGAEEMEAARRILAGGRRRWARRLKTATGES